MPVIARLRAGRRPRGRRCVGAGQRRALDPRAPLAGHPHVSVSPWPWTGATAAARDAGMTAGVAQGEAGARARMVRTHDRGHEGRAAAGDACARPWWAQGGAEAWTERLVVVRSPRHATQQAAGWATRLAPAEHPRAALTPPRGRGTRQITEAVPRWAAMDPGLTAQRVEGLRSLEGAKQTERQTPDVGRGRGAARRPKRVLTPRRSPITPIARQGDPIADRTQRFGWQALVTNAGPKRRSLPEAVVSSRHADRVQRLCNRLKSRVQSAPLLVKRHDHSEGLTPLLTLGVRGWTVMACVLRRSLQNAQATRPGLPPETKHKRTDKPTVERILQAFAPGSLPIVKHAAGEDILRRLTPLSGWQEDSLPRQGLRTVLYGQLAMQEMGN